MDKSTHKLLNGTLIYFVGNALTQVISLVLLRFVTGRITPEEYGIYNLVVTVSNLIIPFVTLQMSDAVFKFLIRAETDEEKQKYYTVSTCIMLLSAVLVVVGVVVTNLFFIKLPHPELIALYITFNAFFNIYQRVVRAFGKNKVFVIGNLIKTIVYLGLEIFLIYVFSLGVEALFLSVTISIILCLIFLEIKTKSLKYFKLKSFDLTTLKKMLRFSLPLIPNAVFWWLTTSINSVIVSAKCGLDINGIYTVANKFSGVLTMVTTVFSLAWQESAISEYGSESFKKFFTDTFNMYVKGVFSVVAVLLPFMFIVFPIMIDSSYHDAIQYAPFLLLASGISAISGFVSQIFIAKNESAKCLYTNLLGMIANIVTIVLLVSKIALWAAVLGTLISNLTLVFARLLLTRKEFGKNLSVWGFIIVFISLAVSVYGYFKFNMVLNIIWFIIAVAIAIYLNFGLIKDILKVLFSKTKKESK